LEEKKMKRSGLLFLCLLIVCAHYAFARQGAEGLNEQQRLSRHNLWGNLWTSDRLFKFDPNANKWTMFELPVHGTEIRHTSLLERDRRLQVIVPVYRSSQIGVMTLRTEAELTAPKRDAQ
jgi:hypothetical protein